MNLLREKQRCLPMHGAAYGGSKSSASTSNQTDITDARVVGGEGSANVSANGGSTVTTTMIATDHGAVQAGMQLGSQAIDAAVKDAAGTQQTAQSLYEGALKFLKDSNSQSQQAYADASGQVAAAYSKEAGDLASAFTDSKAPDKSLLMVAGVIVVGLAGVMVLAKRV